MRACVLYPITTITPGTEQIVFQHFGQKGSKLWSENCSLVNTRQSTAAQTEHNTCCKVERPFFCEIRTSKSTVKLKIITIYFVHFTIL